MSEQTTATGQGMTKPIYQTVIERHYDAGLGLVAHFITELANQAIEIAAKGIALAAPAPNAIGIYNTTQAMGWNWIASITFALSIEVCIFLMVEVSLQQWDGYLQYPAVYLRPLAIAIIFTCVLAIVVMCLVYWLEVHKILTLLPVISLICFVGIGLKRWHEKNLREGVKSVDPRIVKKKVTPKVTQPTVNIVDSNGADGETAAKVDAMNDGKRRKVDAKVDALYGILRDEFDGVATDDLNKAELGRRIGKSRATVGNYLDSLANQGRIDLNGHVKVVK